MGPKINFFDDQKYIFWGSIKNFLGLVYYFWAHLIIVLCKTLIEENILKQDLLENTKYSVYQFQYLLSVFYF